MPLPINISELLKGRIIEHDRIEFKTSWNPDAIYRSICAFANDIENIGGGYILIGVEEENGMAKLPVIGIPSEQIDTIQRQMIGFNNLIKPVYSPKLSIEEIDGNYIIVLWVPGGANRPYEVPEQITAKEKKFFYYIRKYSNSVKVNQQEQQELISLANKVPFDDRVNSNASLNDISITLVRDHLRLTKSRLYEFSESLTKADLLDQMDLISGPPEMLFPKNVALMLFSEKPEKFFPYTRIEVVEFPNGVDDPEFNERPPFTGPVQQQIMRVIDFFKTNILQEKIIKQPNKAEALRIWNYPLEALEEAIANAIYHRDYLVREPVEIRIYPDSITILNYGGPDRSIKPDAFKIGPVKPRRYRNRRLGDFLKELDLTEGKATGIPRIKKAMKENGSLAPVFDFDDDRTFFQVDFNIHPVFKEEQIKVVSIKNASMNLGERAIQILVIIRNDPSITVSEIAVKIEISKRATEKHLSKLKSAGILDRIGSDKSGQWIIKSSV
jgi:ATP-dependent DNA helicase RecG